MSTPVYLVIAVVVAFLVGGIPFGYIAGRLVGGIDIRTKGSGNPGASNVARLLGIRWGLVVLAADAAKGLLPTWAVGLTMPKLIDGVGGDSPEVMHVMVGVGVVAVLGHMYPCWIGWRGGKGVATALGVATILSPVATVSAVVVYLATMAITRFASLSSLLASLSFAIVHGVLMAFDPELAREWSKAAFAVAVPLLIIYRHRGNIGRIFRGEEPRIGEAVEEDQVDVDPSGDAEAGDDEPDVAEAEVAEAVEEDKE